MSSTTTARNDFQDVSHIGTHCQLESCNLNDFLPFVCPSCKQTFCGDHRTESAHFCTRAGAWGEAKRQNALSTNSIGAHKPLVDQVRTEKPCAKPECKTIVGGSLKTGAHCGQCRRDYCLKHRLYEDHDCKNLKPLGARPASAAVLNAQNYAQNATRSAFDRFKSWAKTKKVETERVLPKPKPSSAAARVVAVNKLKKTAKGDAKLAPEKRIYVYVEAEAETTTAKFPKGEFFYSADWVVGRVLDAAAKSLQVQNVNNQSSDEKDKLRVFHVEGGRVLEFSEKFGKTVQSGNTVVLLRGVGGPQDLVEV